MTDPSHISLRPSLPTVLRLSRKVIIGAVVLVALILNAAIIISVQPRNLEPSRQPEATRTTLKPNNEVLDKLPKSYSEITQPAPSQPTSQQHITVQEPSNPEALASGLFVGISGQTEKLDTQQNAELSTDPTRTLISGTIIPAALVTTAQSDLPGLVTAQVTEHVYDSATGQNLLIPQGSKLVGHYSNDLGPHQSRIAIVWTTLHLTDGRSIQLDDLPATDAQGQAGLADEVDFHMHERFAAASLTTLLNLGSELAFGGQSDLKRALSRSFQDTVGKNTQEIIRQQFTRKPTINLRAGLPLIVQVASTFQI